MLICSRRKGPETDKNVLRLYTQSLKCHLQIIHKTKENQTAVNLFNMVYTHNMLMLILVVHLLYILPQFILGKICILFPLWFEMIPKFLYLSLMPQTSVLIFRTKNHNNACLFSISSLWPTHFIWDCHYIIVLGPHCRNSKTYFLRLF